MDPYTKNFGRSHEENVSVRSRCDGTIPSLAAAQVDRATLTGVVRDPSNAAVVGATVTVTHVTTGVSSRVLTSDDGTYLVVNLPPGEVIVEAEATGLPTVCQDRPTCGWQSRQSRSHVACRGGDRNGPGPGRDAAARLSIASCRQRRKPDGSRESAAGESQLGRPPLYHPRCARRPIHRANRSTNAGRTGGVSIHGNRSLQNNFLLDGVDNNSISTNVQELSTQVSRPSIDSIGEFKVVTSPFTAEYGRAPGGAIVVTTKSGTNQIHGTAYEYFRNDSFDSISFFAERANQAKAANDQHQFGANVGGPILENRAFFFFDVEATRITQGVLRTGRVATAEERNGIFSSTISDPLTGLPFANNTIPQFRIDPIARELMALVPMPNATGSNNFIRQPNVEDDGERYLLRTDIKPGSNDNVFARYIYTDRTRFVPGFFGGTLDGTSTSAWGRNFLKSHSMVAGWTSVVSSTRQRVSLVMGERDFRWRAGSIRNSGPAVSRRSGQPDGGRGSDWRRHHGPPPARIAELHAEVPAHRFGSVSEHDHLAEGEPRRQVRHRHHVADEQ